MKPEIRLESFEGPLDLLLHLIEKNKVSIYDIPIREITEQYLDYLKQMQEQKLDVMSEFLVMAATLLEIKAKMLIPKPEEPEEEDPREELVQRLLEYKLAKILAEELKEYEEEGRYYLYHQEDIPKEVSNYREPVDVPALFSDITMDRLKEIFEETMKRRQERTDPIRSRFGTITRTRVRLSDKIRLIQKEARQKKKISFRQLLEKENDKTTIVVTFLAVLEMMKVGQLSVVQSETFGEIDMNWNEEAAGALTEKELNRLEE